MAKTKELPIEQPQPEPETPATTEALTITDIFRRDITSTVKPRTLHFGKVLTRELVSMAHRKFVVLLCEEEMITMNLPVAGRDPNGQPARVVTGLDIDIETGSERPVIMIFNEIMVSALARENYAVINLVAGEKKGEWKEVVVGTKPLKGTAFAFKGGDIRADKRYRQIEVAVLEQ